MPACLIRSSSNPRDSSSLNRATSRRSLRVSARLSWLSSVSAGAADQRLELARRVGIGGGGERLGLKRRLRRVELGQGSGAWRTQSVVEGGQRCLVEDVALRQELFDQRREVVDPRAGNKVLCLSAQGRVVAAVKVELVNQLSQAVLV